MSDSDKSNGFTNKEMLHMLLANQQEMDKKLDQMQSDLNGKVGKMEIMGFVLMLSAILMIANNWVSLF